MAMIMVLSFMALVGSYFIASGLSRTSVEVAIEQDRRSLQAMQEAKAALIAYAASKAWGTDGTNDQPGALPCPSANDQGTAGSSCNATASTRVGRFPWKTIGTSDLRDGAGEILWYALSANFRQASGTTVINSDTVGTLTVTGSTPTSNIVAIIIAPGRALDSQNRSVNAIGNYLESTNATNTDTFVTGQKSLTFNDKMVLITQADLMAVVEPAVASRIERDIKPYIEEYYSVDTNNKGWSAFPFPAVFANPSPGTSGTGTNRAQSSFSGNTSITSGLLPLTASGSYTWTSNTGTASLTGGVASAISGTSSPVCSRSGSNWRCNVTISSTNSVSICGSSTNRHCLIAPRFRVTGNMGTNAGRTFADLPSFNSVTVTIRSGGHPSCTTTLKTDDPNASSISGTLTGTGLGTVNFDATLTMDSRQSSSFICNFRVTIPTVVSNPLTSSSDSTSGWFIKNEWYRQTYYAVAPGYLPGGGSSCTPGTNCLTVNNLPSSYTTANDKRAVLIFAGRALTGTRPSSSLADYLEGENQTPSDRTFTHRSGTAATLNDYAIVIAP